jgi:hypothetical protein
MHKTFALLALVLVPLSLACGAPQKPATFVTSAPLEGGIDVVSRTLAANGFLSPGVDRQSGIVTTEWKDTGFMYGQVQGSTATVVRRFVVVLAPASQGTTVTVRVDAKRCTQQGFVIENAEVHGRCEEMSLIPEKFQLEVDALAAKVQQALATAPSTGKSS